MSILIGNKSDVFRGVKEALRSRRKQFHTSICGNPACLASESSKDTVFKRCAKCKDTWYCSKECQRADWPAHKHGCTASASSRKKLEQYLMANPLTDVYLQVLVIAQLGISSLDDPSLKRMRRVLIFFGIEPADAKDFLKIFHPSAVADERPMRGMMQLHAVYSDPLPHPLRNVDNFALNPTLVELWQRQRQQLDENGQESTPLCMLQWTSTHKDVLQNGAVNLRITPLGMDLARWHMSEKKRNVLVPNLFTDDGDLEAFSTFFSIHTVIEYINGLIRSDTVNRWSLRVPMSQAEKEVIVEAASLKPSLHPVRRLFCDLQRQKALREIAYREALRYYIKRGDFPAKGHPLISATKNDEKYELTTQEVVQMDSEWSGGGLLEF